MIPLLTHPTVAEELDKVQGFIYPNELNLIWSVVIVVYPYLTGLVAGAFIMASLVRRRSCSLRPWMRKPAGNR